MSIDHWDIVSHSVHIYCDWLSCLLPEIASTPPQQAPIRRPAAAHLPRALLTDPRGYARRILWALARFFAPRPLPTASADASPALPSPIGVDTVFSLIHQSPHDAADPLLVAANSVQEIVRGGFRVLSNHRCN